MTVTRIEQRFALAREQSRACLIPFIMGGDPDLTVTSDSLTALAENGADIIEIGMPFSDPVADGPAIQNAGQRALHHTISLDDIFKTVTAFRQTDDQTPVVLMGYYNPVYVYGLDAFASAAAAAGIDGVILVDLPTEEEQEALPALRAAEIALIKLVTPTSDEERLQKILPTASGFVYYVSVAGTTGGKSAQYDQVEKALHTLRRYTDLPVAVGFGIKTPQDVKTVSGFADGVVVGSALVDKMAHSATPVQTAADFTKSLSSALVKNDV